MPASSQAQFRWAEAVKSGKLKASPKTENFATEMIEKQGGKPLSILPDRALTKPPRLKRLSEYK